MLDRCLQAELETLRRLGDDRLVVLLDYETNGDLDDLTRPLSHASLIVRYLDGTWPGEAPVVAPAPPQTEGTAARSGVQYVAGDLFANRVGAQAFAHGCNCQGSMGAGIAVIFRERYPAMYEAYRARCRAQPRQFNLGDAWLWQEDGQPAVFNLGTQATYWRGRASYDAIATALASMRVQADAAGITTIAIPASASATAGCRGARCVI